MTVFTAPFTVPTTSTPYPGRPRDPSAHESSSSSPRWLLRRVNALLVKEQHQQHPYHERRTALVPIFSLAELTPNHLLGLLEAILATRFDLSGERDDRGDESWQSVLDDDDDDDGVEADDRVDEQRLQDERILRFLVLGLQQALEARPPQDDDLDTMLAILLVDTDSSHRLGGARSIRSGVKILQQRDHIIAWIVSGLFEIEDRLLDPPDTQLGYDATADRGENSSHRAEFGGGTGTTSQGTTSATPTTPRKLLFRDSHAPAQPVRTTPLKQALSNYLPPSPSPRLETTPRKSIVDLLRRDEQARSTSPSPKSKRRSLASSSSLVVVKPELERFERSRPRAPIVGVKMARREVPKGVGDSDLDLSERPCDCETEGYRATDEGDQTEDECACCAHAQDEAETRRDDLDHNIVPPIHHPSDRPLEANARRPTWRLTLPDESNTELFPPARFVPTPSARHSPTSSSSSSNEDEFIVNRRRKKERDEVEKMKLRSCGLDTDLEGGPGWVRGWSEKELKGVEGRM